MATFLFSLFCFIIQATSGWSFIAVVLEYLPFFFILAIVALFLHSLKKLDDYRKRLPAQHRALDSVQANCDEVVRTGEINPAAIRAELLKQVDSQSLVADRVEELHRIRAHGGNFDQVAMSEVTAAREGARTSIARFSASVLVLLGLCGAISGLGQMVFRMGPELREMERLANASGQESGATGTSQAISTTIQKSVSTLVNTMSSSLEQTKGAFSASLTGVFLSVVLLLLNWWISRRQVELLAALESLTTTRLIPLFKPPRQESELAGVAETMREGSSHMVRLSNELDNRVLQADRSLENLFNIVSKFGESAKRLESGQDQIFDAQKQLLKIAERFTETIKSLETHQLGAKQTIDGAMAVVGESNEKLNRAIEEWQSRHEKVLQLIQDSSQQARKDLTQSRETINHGFDGTTNLITTTLTKQLGDLRAQALEMMERQQNGTRQHLKEVIESQSSFVQRLQDSIASSDGHRALLNGLKETLKQEKDAFTERLNRALVEERERFAKYHDELAEQNSEFIGKVTEIISALNNLLGNGAAVQTAPSDNSKVVERLDAIIKQLQEIARPQILNQQRARQVDLGTQFERLPGDARRIVSALRMIIGLGVFSISAVTMSITLSAMRYWPDNPVYSVLTLLGVLFTSIIAGVGLAKAATVKRN